MTSFEKISLPSIHEASLLTNSKLETTQVSGTNKLPSIYKKKRESSSHSVDSSVSLPSTSKYSVSFKLESSARSSRRASILWDRLRDSIVTGDTVLDEPRFTTSNVMNCVGTLLNMKKADNGCSSVNACINSQTNVQTNVSVSSIQKSESSTGTKSNSKNSVRLWKILRESVVSKTSSDESGKNKHKKLRFNFYDAVQMVGKLVRNFTDKTTARWVEDSIHYTLRTDTVRKQTLVLKKKKSRIVGPHVRFPGQIKDLTPKERSAVIRSGARFRQIERTTAEMYNCEAKYWRETFNAMGKLGIVERHKKEENDHPYHCKKIGNTFERKQTELKSNKKSSEHIPEEHEVEQKLQTRCFRIHASCMPTSPKKKNFMEIKINEPLTKPPERKRNFYPKSSIRLRWPATVVDGTVKTKSCVPSQITICKLLNGFGPVIFSTKEAENSMVAAYEHMKDAASAVRSQHIPRVLKIDWVDEKLNNFAYYKTFQNYQISKDALWKKLAAEKIKDLRFKMGTLRQANRLKQLV